MIRTLSVTALAVTLLIPCALAQSSSPCSPLTGTVEDNTGALLPGAVVTLDGNPAAVTADSAGRFKMACVPEGRHTLLVTMPGFADTTLATTAPHTGDLHFRLSPATQVSVTVSSDDVQQVAAPGGTNGITLEGKQLDSFADDPDDLQRELQQMAASAGGPPSGTTISVNGFQGDSALPPKDSIAYINVAPDLFSAEYREPPFEGGRVEIYTKPGAKTFHGSLFGTNSSHWMNASDPFTDALGPVGKQRYGFDLSGPIRRQGASFSLSLEHRSIDEVGVVNAIVADANGNPVQTTYAVPQPQRLWVASARVDWQLGPKNIFSANYQANVNHTVNSGVGGNTLLEAGYQDGSYDHTLRFSNITTFSPKMVNEARYSIERRGETDVPNAAGPSQQVSGYFTGGGATIGNQRVRTWINEFDDDVVINTKKHLLKFGTQNLWYFINDEQTTGFNGTYIYGGTAGVNGAGAVTPLAQYLAATARGGTATEFNNVSGTPREQFFQGRGAFFFEDTYKPFERLSLSYGVRYVFETNPGVYNGLVPRGGFTWSPDKKSLWVIEGHAGLFNGNYSRGEATELNREDGVQRVTSLVYNPVYGAPFTGATPIHEYRTAPGLTLPTNVIGTVGLTRLLPHGFSLSSQLIGIRLLTDARTLNINSPLVNIAEGTTATQLTPAPRPLAANVNILQSRDDGTGQGLIEFIGLSNSKLKRVQFFMGAVHINLRTNTGHNFDYQQQSVYSNAGEEARGDNSGPLWQTFGNVNVQLPYKLQLSGNGYANGGAPFNLLTGSDNNLDGNFNDRPQYAAPGSVANGTTVFNTPLGLLTNAGAYVDGVPQRPIVRDLGALPWNFHLDANLQRKWVITRDTKAVHQQTITANVRSANFLNHTNVTAEGSVLGSPQFLVPIAADTARRVEFGLRYSF